MSHSSHRKRPAAPPTSPPAEQLRAAREILRLEAKAHVEALESARQIVLPDRAYAASQCKGSVIVTGMGKAGIIGQKIAATLASHRHAGPLPAPGRSLSRRPGPHPRQRRRADAHAKRRDERSRAAAAVAQRIRRAARGGHRVEDQHRRPRGHRRHRARPTGRSLLARPRAEHEHDGDARGGRRARAGARASCAISGPRISPASIRAVHSAASSAAWTTSCGRSTSAARPATARPSAR